MAETSALAPSSQYPQPPLRAWQPGRSFLPSSTCPTRCTTKSPSKVQSRLEKALPAGLPVQRRAGFTTLPSSYRAVSIRMPLLAS